MQLEATFVELTTRPFLPTDIPFLWSKRVNRELSDRFYVIEDNYIPPEPPKPPEETEEEDEEAAEAFEEGKV